VIRVNPPTIAELSARGRRAVERGEWANVTDWSARIIALDPRNPEGHFLQGMAEKAARRVPSAAASFERALALDAGRYDAAIELAYVYCVLQRHAEAKGLLERYAPALGNSPLYLNLAGIAYSMMTLHDRAWAMHAKACALQPGVDLFESNLAASSVYVGRIDEARAIYQRLLERSPTHQRHHYQLGRLERAKDARHVDQMLAVLAATRLPPEKNIFLYYALGKELEDLGRWDEAFAYYQLAGDTITRMGHYDVASDLAVIDAIVASCTASWLAQPASPVPPAPAPIFIVGLPRTGTTVTERILSSHSQVATLDETQFIQKALQREAGFAGAAEMTPAIIEAAARADAGRIARSYLEAVRYRLGPEPLFIDKLPENLLYLGFIAKGFPQARLIHLRRHPMDACFAMYKQSFFKFAYSLEHIGRYYVAHQRLVEHWRAVLGERLIDVEYEALVRDQEGQTRALLERLGLPFEAACLEFERNASPSATASAAQVREKMHARSVGRWRHFERHLQPLRDCLEQAGIPCD
jgi:tetratricopeptide (TPR) repeat protein